MDFQNYYKNSFPSEDVFNLFNRHDSNTANLNEKKKKQKGAILPSNREWGIETTDGVFMRYKSCETTDDLKKLVSQPNVGKVNTGAVYNETVSLRWKRSSLSAIYPIRREFIIDIDLTDYASSGISISKDDVAGNDTHWPLVGIGMIICKTILEESFGFNQFLVVYSGRRGAHLWILDERASKLDNNARSAIISFMTPPDKVGEHGRKNFKTLLGYPTFGSGMNPRKQSDIGVNSIFQRLVYKFWMSYAIQPLGKNHGLGLLDTRFQREKFLLMSDVKLSVLHIREILAKPDGVSCFQLIEELIHLQPRPLRDWTILRMCESICTLVWPRPDTSVSTHMNHTLKSPYSVHPGTGRVSMPVFEKNLINFDPSKCPLASDDMPASFYENVNLLKDLLAAFASPQEPAPPAPEPEPAAPAPQMSEKAKGKRKMQY